MMSSNEYSTNERFAQLIKDGTSFFFEATNTRVVECPVIFYSVISISSIWKVSVKCSNGHYHLGSFNKKYELDLRGSKFNTNDIEVQILNEIITHLEDIPDYIIISL